MNWKYVYLTAMILASAAGARASHREVHAEFGVQERVQETALTNGFFFVLYDLGEATALLPVINELHDRKEPVQVLLLGAAERFRDCLPSATVYQPGTPSGVNIPKVAGRLDEVGADFLAMLECDIAHSVIITGVSSRFAGQCHEKFRPRSDVHTVCYWDNFAVTGDSDYFIVAQAVAKSAEQVFFPRESTAKAFSKYGEISFQVVGNPAIDAAYRSGQAINCDRQRETLGVEEDEVLVVYSGSYDQEPGYERNFLAFAKIWVAYQQAHPKTNLIIVPHPKSVEKGSMELGMIRMQGGGSPDPVVMQTSEIAHETIAGAARLVCLEKSTVAEKLAVMGAKVVHIFDNSNVRFSTALLEAGVTKRVTDLEEFELAAREGVSREGIAAGAISALMLPKDSTRIATEALIAARDELMGNGKK